MFDYEAFKAAYRGRAAELEDAANGFADDELVAFAGDRFSAWWLRNMADEINEEEA